MAEAKRIKATPVVQPPDTIQLTLTLEEAEAVRALIGKCKFNDRTSPLFDALRGLGIDTRFDDLFYFNEFGAIDLKRKKDF